MRLALWRVLPSEVQDTMDGPESVDSWVTTILDIVNRDYNASPALCDQQCPSDPGAYCELPRGHANRSGRGHSATVTRAVDW